MQNASRTTHLLFAIRRCTSRMPLERTRMPIFGFLYIKWYKSMSKYETGLNEACSALQRHMLFIDKDIRSIDKLCTLNRAKLKFYYSRKNNTL